MAANCDVNVALDETVDDVLIFAEVSLIDGVGNILGQAGPCFARAVTGFPVVGDGSSTATTSARWRPVERSRPPSSTR